MSEGWGCRGLIDSNAQEAGGWSVAIDTLPLSRTECWASAMQRSPSVAIGNRVHGTWHEAVIGLRDSATASTTGVEGAEVIQRDRP